MIKIFLDTADLNLVTNYRNDERICGFTTNPTLMRNAGVKNYLSFAKTYLDLLDGRPLSLEVFADSESEMIKQAHALGKLSKNIYVKIPIFFTNGQSTANVIKELSGIIKLNITAVTHASQLNFLQNYSLASNSLIISYFAGRVADAGYDFIEIAKEVRRVITNENIELLWASTREIHNIKHATQSSFDIITITPDLFKKLDGFGKNLDQISIDTIKMFYGDAIKSKFKLP